MTASSTSANFSSTPTFDREGTLQTMSDYHKEAYGFRPRGINYEAFSNEELLEACTEYGKVCAENEVAEKAFHQKATLAHETLIQKTISLGATDRTEALKWLYEGSDCTQPDHECFYGSYSLNDYVYQLGLLCSDYGDKISKELLSIFCPGAVWSKYS